MKVFRAEWSTPEEQLAADEALLDACEAGEAGTGGGVLRFYETATPCVVVGYGNRLATEVDVAACDAAGVPVLRRASGGGTVLLGPGCLAYAVVLPVGLDPALETVTGTNRWVMERNRTALEAATGLPVVIRGHTDLAVDDWKFSGNAQRRRRRAVLFHGTFLLGMDLEPVARLLPPPSSEPEYRRGRAHGAFIRNLGVSSDRVRGAMEAVWGVAGEWTGSLGERVAGWMGERYGRREWHRRF